MLVCIAPARAQTQRPSSSCKSLAVRGFATFCIFFVAIALARSFPALAGILANLPIVSCTIVVVLWTGHGEDGLESH